MERTTKITFAIAIAALALLFALHRDLSLTGGNSEWDCVDNIHGRGTIERSTSLRDAFQPDGFYGPGYAAMTRCVRAPAGAIGVPLDAFRGAQVVTVAFSVLFLVAAWLLGRALGVAPDLQWVPVAALACAWTFLNMAVQVTTDVAASALIALAMVPLFRAQTVRAGLASGALLGVAFMVRVNALPYALLFMAVGLLVPAEPAPLRRRALFVLAIAGGFVLAAAPRFAADLVHTGKLIHQDHGQNLRAVLLEGGFESYRAEPESLFSVIARAPGPFFRAFLASYAYYERALLPLIAVPAALLVRAGGAPRRQAIAALLLVLGLPLGPSILPAHYARYVLPLFPIPIALWTVALDRHLGPRLRPLASKILAPALAVLFALEVGLLVDKYRFDVPEAAIRSALSEANTGDPPTVLVRHGVPFDVRIHDHAVKYRLRRVRASFIPAPNPIDEQELRRLGAKPPFFVLRVPFPDTGPSVVADRLRGRPREVFRPAPDPVLAGGRAARVVHDPVSGIELYRVIE